MNWFFWCVLALSVPLVLCEVEPAEEEVPKVVLSESFSSSTSKPGLPTSDGTQGTEIPGGLGFFHGFIASLSVIIVSEIGDKTFFIAAIMAMKRSRLTVFAGAMSALAFMTVLSVFFGWAATIIPRAYTYYASTALFAIFGLKMLYEGYKTTKNQNLVELEDVKAELYANDLKYESHGVLLDDGESGGTAARSPQERRLWFLAVSRFFIQAFTLTFLAEWGDRSQLATIILAARENVYGVTFGGIVGHSICTGIAVVGGRAIAQKISVRTVTLIGGVVFLLFAFSALFFDPNAP